MRQHVKRAIVAARRLVLSPLRQAAFGQRALLTCLNYHRVIFDSEVSKRLCPGRGIGVSARNFDVQMRYLHDHVRCLNLADFIAALHAGNVTDDCVHVSFDDGYRDNLEQALPILERYKVPASIFVTVGFIEGNAEPWWYELENIVEHSNRISIDGIDTELSSQAAKRAAFERLTEQFKSLSPAKQTELLHSLRVRADQGRSFRPVFLSWDELTQLSKSPLITIGSHTMTHAVLSQLSAQQLQAELMGARRKLEERLGIEVPYLAYPFGEKAQASEREFSCARALGFKAAFTMRYGHIVRAHRAYPLALPRVPIVFSDSLNDFAFKLCGFEALRRNGFKQVILD